MGRQVPVPEVPGFLLIVRKQLLLRLGQRAPPQKQHLLFLVDSPWSHFPFFAAVPGRLSVLITHELSVRTAACAVVSASACRQFAERARARPWQRREPKSRRSSLVQVSGK